MTDLLGPLVELRDDEHQVMVEYKKNRARAIAALGIAALTRDELLVLAAVAVPRLHPGDVLFARWWVAVSQASEAGVALSSAWDDRTKAWHAYEAALKSQSDRAIRLTRRAYNDADEAYDKITKKRKAAQRREERLRRVMDDVRERDHDQ